VHCSEISINLVFRSQCYFASTFYSTAYLFHIISFCFLFCILHYVACAFVICLIKYLLTYLKINACTLLIAPALLDLFFAAVENFGSMPV